MQFLIMIKPEKIRVRLRRTGGFAKFLLCYRLLTFKQGFVEDFSQRIKEANNRICLLGTIYCSLKLKS